MDEIMKKLITQMQLAIFAKWFIRMNFVNMDAIGHWSKTNTRLTLMMWTNHTTNEPMYMKFTTWMEVHMDKNQNVSM